MVITKGTNKLISALLLIVFITVSFFNAAAPAAYAATGATGESESEALSKIQIIPANGDTMNCVKLDGRPQLCRFSYYVGTDSQGNEKNYPTYCVEPNLEGVNTLGEYEAVLTETVKHPRVYGAVLNGYPYKTLGELGVNTNLEGYYATRNVVWSLVKGWNISQWTSDGSAEGNRVLSAMQQIYAASKDYTELPVELMVKVTKNAEKATVDAKDSQYVSTTYTITANKNLLESISVEFADTTASRPTSAKIVDMNNNPKSTFALNDDFKVIVSKAEADAAKDLKLDLSVKVKGRDNAIFYAKSQNPHGQDYYAARDPIAVKNVDTDFIYGAPAVVAPQPTPDEPSTPVTPPANTDGVLNIIKQDSQTNKGLAGARFNVQKNGTDLGVYGSDSQGRINIPINTDSRIGYIDEHDGQLKYRNMEKGKVLDSYVITEIDPPYGYLLDTNNVQTAAAIADGLGGVMDDTLIVTFKNQPYGALTILKTDADTGESLTGAVFRLTYLPGANDGYHFTTDLTTNDAGAATISGLKPGSYSVEEITAPAKYILNSKKDTITITAGETTTYTATNQHLPGIEIVKLDENEQLAVAGATFNVRGINNNYNQDFVTDQNGKITLENLEAGSYTITETVAAPGYDLRPDNTQSVELEPGKSVQLIFYNKKLSVLEITKIEKVSQKPLSGVTYTIQEKGGNIIGDYTTDTNGKIRLEGLAEGWYTITEKNVPNGVILDKTPHDVYLKVGEVTQITLQNSIKPKLIIQKNDSVSHSPVAHAKFQVWHAVNGSLSGELQSIGTFTTDSSGQIGLEQVEPGWYRITEIEAPQGYISTNLPSRDVFMEADKDKTITFENTPKSALVVKKVDSDSGEPLAGAKFNVRYLSGTSGTGGTVIGEYTTGVNGTFIVTGLEAGTYVVEETKAPENYLMTSDTAKTVYISGQEQDIVTIEFTNKKISGLLVRKLDSITKQPLAGAEFKITDSSGAVVGSSNGLYTTDADGYIHLPDIDPGTYVVVEQKAPEGYLVDRTPQTVKIESNATHDLTFYNEPKCQLVIEKLNAADHQPLAGATFKVTNSKGEVVGSDNGLYTTGATGVIKITGLMPGSYVIEEIAAPEGFLIDQSSQTIKLEDAGAFTVTFYNYPKGSLVIEKLDKDTKEPLADAVFKVTTAKGTVVGNDNGLFRTDGSGLILIPNLTPGGYIVQEVTAPDGYLLDNVEKTIDITPEKVHKVTFYNQAIGGLVIKKMDAQTKEPLADVIFKVTTSDGAVVGTNENGEYRTDENGYISIRGLKPDTYIVTEVQAKEGYLLDDTPKTVVIKDQQTYTVEFFNHRQGNLLIVKKDAVTGKPLPDAVFKITTATGEFVANKHGHLSSNGVYTTDENGQILLSDLAPDTYVVTEEKAPAGYILDGTPQTVVVNTEDTQTLTFTNAPKGGLTIVKSDEETGKRIANVTFEIRKLNGEVIGSYKTDSNGLIHLPQIENGWYSITELEAADGYLADKTPHQIEVKDGETKTLEITNRKASQILLHKIDSQTKEGIAGVTFLLSDSTNKPIGQYTTDQNGYIYLDEGLTDGKYFIREIDAADGYQLDNSVRTFYIRYGTTAEIVWENTAEKGQIQIIKKSAEDNPMNGIPAGTLLPGAVFEIYNKAGDVVDTIRTDKNGRALSKPLPLTRYTIREVQAPEYYGINPTVLDAEIEFAGQIVRFEVVDPVSYINVSVDKTGYAQVVPGQEIQWEFKNVANNSTVALQSFYWRDTLPNAVRLEKIVTGTWNKQLSYKVSYKTNLHDYRTLADHLATNKVHVLDASPVALGLAGNEYVTEIMFSFGIVQPGFAQVETPRIYGTVLANLPHEYRFVNLTDVGGIWQNQWQMANDRWVTVVYNKAGTPSLPKTGY